MVELTPQPLLLIHGEEPYLVDAAYRRWRGERGAAEVEVFDSPAKLEGFRSSIAEVPLFDPERVVVLRNPSQLTGAVRGGEGAQALADALGLRAPTTAVCLVSTNTVPPSNPVLSAVSASGGSIVHFPRLKGRDLREWLQRSARDRGLRLDNAAFDHLLTTVGSDLGALSSELDKLVAFAAGKPVRFSDVRRLAAGDGQTEVWAVLEGILGPEPGRGAAAADALIADGGSTQYLLATLAGQIRELLWAKALLHERHASAAVIASELRLPPWRADRLVRNARELPGRVALQWLRDLHRIDVEVKSGLVDDAAALRSFVRRAAASVVATRTPTRH